MAEFGAGFSSAFDVDGNGNGGNGAATVGACPRLWAEYWTRPGHATFGRVIDDAPASVFSFHDGISLVGNGSMQIAESFERFDEILKLDPSNPANSVSSLCRIFSEEDAANPIFEWLPNLILPTTDKKDLNVDIAGLGIKSILAHARTEAFDWDGSDDFVPKAPDWIWGGRNLLRNPGFELSGTVGYVYNVRVAAEQYSLWHDGSAGDFTLTMEGDVATIDWDDDLAAITTKIEATAGITDVDIEPTFPFADLSVLVPGTAANPWIITFATPHVLAAGVMVDNDAGLTGNTTLTTILDPALTFTLSWDGEGPTAAIAWNAVDTTVNDRLEALANITDVLVSGDGTPSVPWRVEFVDPSFAVTTGLSCVGVGCTIATLQVGTDEIPDAWEPSQRADRRSTTALHGNPNIFRRSSGAEPARTGDHSLVIAGTEPFTGGQQVLSVKPGGTYQMSVYVRANSGGQSFRLVARDRYENILTTAAGTEAFVEVSPAADTWTEMAITDVIAELHGSGEEVAEVVFRFANIIEPAAAGIWFFEDAVLQEGLAPTHPGGILTALYDDATTNHAERLVWEDEANPGNPYLTLDFGALDSAGAAWVDQEISIKIWMRMTYLDVMNQFTTTWGYEWRVVPDVVEDGSWKLQVYNPGTMKTDYTAAQTPAIQGGESDVRRQIRRYLPSGTDLLVEGEERITSRDRDGDLVTALGRIESSRIDRELPSSEAVIAAAFEDKTDAIVSGLSYVYSLVCPADEPLSVYVLGDLLTIHDPPEVTAEARLVDIVVVSTPTETVYETEWMPVTAEGS